MALKNCKECGAQVSTQAKACPSCGAKVVKQASVLGSLIVISVGVFFIYGLIEAPSNDAGRYSSSSVRSTQSAGGAASRTVTSAQPTWTTSTSKDQMTGAAQAFAASPRVTSQSPMEFPYSDTQAWLGVGCDGKSEWSYIGFTNQPNLNRTDIEDGYNIVRTRVRWNEAVEQTSFRQQWGASFLHFGDYRPAIAKMVASNSMLLELDWHGQRPVYFQFSLRGSSAAIASIREQCSKMR